MNFKNLHQQASPLLIANVWDVASAQAAQKANYQAIATSSGAMATMLGYPDGEVMSFQELAYLIKRIRHVVDLSLSVDLEAGYSRNISQIVEHISQLHTLGVVGINLEDSLVEQGTRTLVEAEAFSKQLAEIHKALHVKNIDIFINVRTDTFLLQCKRPIQETIRRAKLYQQAGANGLFVPCIEKQNDIEQVLQHISLPLNVMCMPNLPDFKILKTLGVHRISMGNFAFNAMQHFLEKSFSTIQVQQSFKSIL